MRAFQFLAALGLFLLTGAAAYAQSGFWSLTPPPGFPFPFTPTQPWDITISYAQNIGGTASLCCPPGYCTFKIIETGEEFAAVGNQGSATITSLNPPTEPKGSYTLDLHIVCGYSLGTFFSFFSVVDADITYYATVSCDPTPTPRLTTEQKRRAVARHYTPRPNQTPDQSCECQAFATCGGQWVPTGGAPCCNHVVCPGGNCCSTPGVVQCG